MVITIISYLVLLQIATLCSALILFLYGKFHEHRKHKLSYNALTILWLIVQIGIILITFCLSVSWFHMIGIEDGQQHAMIISIILGIVVLVATPFLYRKIKLGSKELFQEEHPHDGHIYQ